MLDELRKQAAIIEKLIRGLEAAEEKPPEPPAAVDLTAWKTSVRNRILAGSGQVFPTLDGKAPLVTDKELDAILPGLADERARVVDVALALDAEIAKPIEAKPVEDLKP